MSVAGERRVVFYKRLFEAILDGGARSPLIEWSLRRELLGELIEQVLWGIITETEKEAKGLNDPT